MTLTLNLVSLFHAFPVPSGGSNDADDEDDGTGQPLLLIYVCIRGWFLRITDCNCNPNLRVSGCLCLSVCVPLCAFLCVCVWPMFASICVCVCFCLLVLHNLCAYLWSFTLRWAVLLPLNLDLNPPPYLKMLVLQVQCSGLPPCHKLAHVSLKLVLKSVKKDLYKALKLQGMP